jgi:hypothetical protein
VSAATDPPEGLPPGDEAAGGRDAADTPRDRADAGFSNRRGQGLDHRATPRHRVGYPHPAGGPHVGPEVVESGVADDRHSRACRAPGRRWRRRGCPAPARVDPAPVGCALPDTDPDAGRRSRARRVLAARQSRRRSATTSRAPGRRSTRAGRARSRCPSTSPATTTRASCREDHRSRMRPCAAQTHLR